MTVLSLTFVRDKREIDVIYAHSSTFYGYLPGWVQYYDDCAIHARPVEIGDSVNDRPRDYLSEAYRIARGESTLLLPQREHLIALVEQNGLFKRSLEMLTKQYEQDMTDRDQWATEQEAKQQQVSV